MSRSSPAAALFVLLVGCVTTQPRPEVVAAPDAGVAEEVEVDEAPPVVTGLRFEVVPGDAEITIGGESHGQAVDAAGNPRVVRLPPGLYQVTLRSPGYATWRAEVAVRDATELIAVSLEKR